MKTHARTWAVALLLAISGALQAQPFFYHADQDKNAQLAAATARQVTNGTLFTREAQNLDLISRLEIQRTFSSAEVLSQAMINAFQTWQSVLDQMQSTKTALQAAGPAPSPDEAKAQIAEVQTHLATLKAAIARLNKPVAADEDIVEQIKGHIKTAEDAARFAESIPHNAQFNTAIANVKTGLDDAAALYNAFATAYEARQSAENQVGKITAAQHNLPQQQMLKLMSLELNHLHWLAQNSARHAMESGSVLALIGRVESRLNPLSPDEKRKTIQDSLDDLARTAHEAASPADRAAARTSLQNLLLALHEAAAVQAQRDLPTKLARLRETQEQARYAIQRSGVQVRGTETQIQNVTALLALYYQGGIKPAQLAQLLYNLSGMVSLPILAAK